MDRTGKVTSKIEVGKTVPYLLWAGAVLFLSLFILFPLLCVFSKIRISDLTGIFVQTRYRKTIFNTFILCITSTSLSVVTGYIYAYGIVFGKIPFKKFFASLPVLHLITPPFVGGLAFILLLGRQGLITKTFLHLDISLYGLPGLLIAQVLCFFPLAYLMCRESLEALNRNLIEGALSLGASRWKIFMRIILPLTFPAVVSSFLFIAVSVLSDFGNPMIVGGRFKVLAVEIYTQLTGWMNAGVSAALGFVLLVPSLLLFILQNRLFRKQHAKTAVLGSKNGVRGAVFENSKIADVFLFCFILFIALCIMLQFISIVAGSFQKLWGINTAWTLEHLKKTLRYGKDFANSLSFAFTASVVSALIAAFVSFAVHRGGSKFYGKNIIDSLIQLPSAVPGSLLGLALSITAGTLHIRAPKFFIFIAITVSFMPFSYRIITSTFGQIKMTMDEGARSLGAGPLKILGSILFPLGRGGIYSGWTYNFARGVGTLSSVIFLVSFNTPLCSVRILNLAEQGDWGRAAAMALELTLITFIIIGLGQIISKGKLKRK